MPKKNNKKKRQQRPQWQRSDDVTRARAMIAEKGWFISTGTEHGTPVTYTVGLTAQGLPELGTIGCEPELAQLILTLAGAQVIEAGAAPEPGPFPLAGYDGPLRLAVKARSVTLTREMMHTATAIYGDRVQGLWLSRTDVVMGDDDITRVRAMIAEKGWAVCLTETTAGENGEHAPVAYTAGLTAEGLPELGMIGCPPDLATLILDFAAAQVIEAGVAPEPGPFPLAGYDEPLVAKDTGNALTQEAMEIATEIYGDCVAGLWLWPAGAIKNEPGDEKKREGE